MKALGSMTLLLLTSEKLFPCIAAEGWPRMDKSNINPAQRFSEVMSTF